MLKRTSGRLCALVVLTLTLLIAGSNRADAAQRLGPAAGLWGWLESLWQEGVGALARQQWPAPARNGSRAESPVKNCTAVDPNGICPGTGGSTTSLCGPGGCTGSGG